VIYRKEPRKAIAARVQAAWLDQKGTQRVLPAMLEDISPGGASIRIRAEIRVGSQMEIRWRGEDFTGVVKHCRPSGYEYILGIQKNAPVEA
jgi:PilZ domain-containing protein